MIPQQPMAERKTATVLKAAVRALGHFWQAARELCFPSACLICKARLPAVQDLHLCPACLGKLVLVKPPLCSCCGQIFPAAAGGNHLCSTCLSDPFPFSKARALLSYNDPAAQLIHAFKYGGRTTAFSTFAELWRAGGPAADLERPDLIIPVPLHRERLRERGFNQALLLAALFFKDQRKKIDPTILKRSRKTPQQTTLSGVARRHNLKNAFTVVAPEKVRGKRIMIVDDVFTTGATINECCRELRKAGALDVQAVTLARSFR